jgi:hypothetical protein
MSRLAERQRAFGSAILDAARPVPAGLVGPDGRPSPRRFAVYRNNVVMGLVDAIRDAFPAVCRIVGEDFFQALARAYVVAEPPASPILLDYGRGFADFIAGFPACEGLPYLADVARIERAWVEAYHAADAAPLTPESLMSVAPEHRGDIRFSLHPAVRVVRSGLPALTIWRMNAGDGEPAPVDLDGGGEDALITRPHALVEVRQLPPGGADFILQLAGGASVLQALRVAGETDAGFDLAANLSGLLEAGALAAWHLDATPQDQQPGSLT